MDDTTLDLLFPTKSSGDAGLVVAIKFISHSGDVGTIYTVNGQPMFFRTDAGLFPTVYALWIHPGLLFSMPTHGAVMKKLFDGADLMLPGVHKSRMDSSKAAGKVVGDACSVLITGYPFPLSVGSLLVAGSDLINPAFDWRGRGVKTVHFFQDFLWASGDKSEPPPVREELSAGGVGSGGGVNQIVDDDDEEEEGKEERDGQDNDNDLVIVEQTEDDLDIVDWVEMQQQQQQPQEDQDSMIQQVQQSTESMQLAEDASPSTTTPSLSPAAMDELLETAFYTAISLKIPQEDSKLFPMLSSILYSTYILPSRPADTALDISKTTFKKLQKFLKAMEKKGVLKLKERNSELVITAISFKHPNVLAFIPPRRLACDQPLQSTLSSSSPTNAVTSTSAANNNTASGDVGVEDLYKPVGDLIPILKEIGVEW